jgi:hypothetical protein
MKKIYICKEGFSLRESEAGWEWQETGADGWSQLYETKEKALEAIDAEYCSISLELLKRR